MSGQRCPLKNTSIAVGNFVECLVPHTIYLRYRVLGNLPAAPIKSLHAVPPMIMLTGINAFEARWQSLKDHYPTSAAENRLLMQSMGRLVDNYATQEELLDELPLKRAVALAVKITGAKKNIVYDKALEIKKNN